MEKLQVKFKFIKGIPNIIYLDNDANIITEEMFEEDLRTGYRAGLILIPVSNAIQLQVAMTTPYHKDHYDIDPTFVVENFNNYCEKQDNPKLNTEEDVFYIGEVFYE